jgi:hypothetical protein
MARPPLFGLRCLGCGYAVRVRIAPDRCPMCGGSAWEHEGRRRDEASDLDAALVRDLTAQAARARPRHPG